MFTQEIGIRQAHDQYKALKLNYFQNYMKGTVFGIPAAGLFALLLLPAHAEPEGVAEGNFDNSISDNLLSRANKADPNFSIPKLATDNYATDFKRPSNIICDDFSRFTTFEQYLSPPISCGEINLSSSYSAEDRKYLNIFNFLRNNTHYLKNGGLEKLQNKLISSVISKVTRDASQYSSKVLESLPFVLNASVDLDVGVNSDFKYGLSAIYKLATTHDKDFPEYDESILFGQTKVVGTSSSGSTWNVGIGGRKIFNDNTMAGINGFWDYRITPHNISHSRFGLGGELFWKNLELRNNWYIPGTGAQNVTINSVTFAERVVPGWDLEIGYRLESLPELALYARTFRWDYKHTNDNTGVELSANYQLTPKTNLDVYISNEIPAYPGLSINDIKYNDWLLGLRVTYSARPKYFKKSSSYKEKFQTLMKQPVRRRYDVLLERRQTSFSVSLSGR